MKASTASARTCLFLASAVLGSQVVQNRRAPMNVVTGLSSEAQDEPSYGKARSDAPYGECCTP